MALMHSIHRGRAVFPYHVPGRSPAQETLIGCAGLRNIKFEGIERLPVFLLMFLFSSECISWSSSFQARFAEVEWLGIQGFKVCCGKWDY
jgi:hypothetical protein